MGRKSLAMYKRIHGNFLDLLFRRQLDRAPANSHASRVQATPPPCPLCSQKVPNCLPNAYYTWRGSFYCIGHVKKDVRAQTMVGLHKRSIRLEYLNLCVLDDIHNQLLYLFIS